MEKIDPSELVTSRDAAKMLDMSASSLQHHRDSGSIVPNKIGHGVFYLKDDVRKFGREHKRRDTFKKGPKR